MQQPIYLFSMPRSGSTLIQRILAGHSSIATVSEPWVLLPCLYAQRTRGIYAEYEHDVLVEAINDFVGQLPGGQADYQAAIRETVMRLYQKASPADVHYFLDKTPRYHLVAEEIIATFPQAKYLFLWRNPLAIAASISQTYGEGRWNIYNFNVDFYRGLPNLIDAYQVHQQTAWAVRFEDFILDPKAYLNQLLAYLEVDQEQAPKILKTFAGTVFEGNLGDPTGVVDYQKVNREPLEKWKRSFANPFRKAWGRRYLRWLGAERLAVMGYNLDELLAELDAIPTQWGTGVADLLRITVAPVYSLLKNFYTAFRASLRHRIRLS